MAQQQQRSGLPRVSGRRSSSGTSHAALLEPFLVSSLPLSLIISLCPDVLDGWMDGWNDLIQATRSLRPLYRPQPRCFGMHIMLPLPAPRAEIAWHVPSVCYLLTRATNHVRTVINGSKYNARSMTLLSARPLPLPPIREQVIGQWLPCSQTKGRKNRKSGLGRGSDPGSGPGPTKNNKQNKQERRTNQPPKRRANQPN